MNDNATQTDPANTTADPNDLPLPLNHDDVRAPVTYAYLRVSTGQQDVEAQRHGILTYANNHGLGQVRFVEDTASGRKKWTERALGDLLSITARRRDRVIFAETSRIARSTLQVLEVMQHCAEAGVSLHVVKEGHVLDGSASSKVMVTMLALAAEIERDMISMRTREALAARKAAGVKLGRPVGSGGKSRLDKREIEIRGYLDKKVSKRAIAKIIECSPSTLYDWIKRKKIKTAA